MSVSPCASDSDLKSSVPATATSSGHPSLRSVGEQSSPYLSPRHSIPLAPPVMTVGQAQSCDAVPTSPEMLMMFSDLEDAARENKADECVNEEGEKIQKKQEVVDEKQAEDGTPVF